MFCARFWWFCWILVKISKFTNQEDILLGSVDIVYQINGLIEMPKPTNRCLSNCNENWSKMTL